HRHVPVLRCHGLVAAGGKVVREHAPHFRLGVDQEHDFLGRGRRRGRRGRRRSEGRGGAGGGGKLGGGGRRGRGGGDGRRPGRRRSRRRRGRGRRLLRLDEGDLQRGRGVAPVLVHSPGEVQEQLLGIDALGQRLLHDVAL